MTVAVLLELFLHESFALGRTNRDHAVDGVVGVNHYGAAIWT